MARSLRGTVGLLLAVALLPMSLGCFRSARHGLLLRGDWSLEVNRTPWLDGRQVVHEDRSEGSCGPDACDAGPACGGPGCVGPACAPSGAACVGPGCATCRPRMGRSNDAAMAQANYHNHPRFHPVPTQPVFAQRPYAGPPVDPEVTPAANLEMPTMAPSMAPAPMPSAPPQGSSSWRPQSGEPLSVASVQQQSWIFAPADEAPVAEPTLNPARQLSLSKSSAPQQRSPSPR